MIETQKQQKLYVISFKYCRNNKKPARPRSYRKQLELKCNGNSTETRVAQKRITFLQSPIYKRVYTESFPICSN